MVPWGCLGRLVKADLESMGGQVWDQQALLARPPATSVPGSHPPYINMNIESCS